MNTEAEIRQIISGYVDHLEDASYVHALLTAASMEVVLDVLCRMVRSGAAVERGAGMLFALDVGRHHFMPDEETVAFREGMVARGVLDALHECLQSNDYQARSGAVNTLGRLCFRESIPALTAALGRCLERDPLLLADLLGELFWLKSGCDWELLERTSADERYLFRWSVAPFLWPSLHEPHEEGEREGEYVKQKRLAERLAEDFVPSVRDEGRYCLERMLLKERGPRMDRAESKRRAREIKRQFEPSISFDLLRLKFLNQRAAADYTVEELQEFHETLLRQ